MVWPGGRGDSWVVTPDVSTPSTPSQSRTNPTIIIPSNKSDPKYHHRHHRQHLETSWHLQGRGGEVMYNILIIKIIKIMKNIIIMKITIFFSPGTNHFPPTGMGTVAGCTCQVILGPSLSNYHQFIFLQKRSQCIFKMQHRDETPLFTFNMTHFLTGGGLFFP